MNKKILGLITFFIIILICFCTENKADGADKYAKNLTGLEYREAESEYISQVRAVLDENGFCNAGINLDKVTTNQGDLAYTLSIHHRRFAKIDDSKKNEIREDIENLMLDVRFSRVSVVYIE